jgi:hypothetical protein
VPGFAIEWKDAAPFPGSEPGQFSATWETVLIPPETGSYEFVLLGTDQACLLVDGVVVLHRFEGGSAMTGKSLELTAGNAYQLRVELWPSRSELRVKLGWIPPWARRAEQDDVELFEAARRADAVLFFGGLSHQIREPHGAGFVSLGVHVRQVVAYNSDCGLIGQKAGQPD